MVLVNFLKRLMIWILQYGTKVLPSPEETFSTRLSWVEIGSAINGKLLE